MKVKNKILSSAIAGIMALSMVGSLGVSAADNTAETSSVTNEIAEVNTDSTYATVSVTSTLHKLKSTFPNYKQAENSFYCWAECARAIINYKIGTSYTCDDIIRKAIEISQTDPAFGVSPNGSANAETTFGVIGNYLGPYGYLTTITGLPLSISDVKYYIDNDVPILMCLQNSDHSVGHMVVITGYGTAKYDYPSLGIYTGDFTGLYYMDPMSGTQSFHRYFASDGNFSVTVNNYQTGNKDITLSWTRAIYSYKYFN